MKSHSDVSARNGSRGVLGLAILATALLLATACATTSTTARDREIEQRAQARWDALLAGDFDEAYSFASPGYRSANSAADFEISYRTRRMQYTSAEYQQHSCEEAVCTVSMLVGYRVVRPARGLDEWKSTSMVEERWIETQGQWWFVPES
jgi:hypothetical protein